MCGCGRSVRRPLLLQRRGRIVNEGRLQGSGLAPLAGCRRGSHIGDQRLLGLAVWIGQRCCGQSQASPGPGPRFKPELGSARQAHGGAVQRESLALRALGGCLLLLWPLTNLKVVFLSLLLSGGQDLWLTEPVWRLMSKDAG